MKRVITLCICVMFTAAVMVLMPALIEQFSPTVKTTSVTVKDVVAAVKTRGVLQNTAATDILAPHNIVFSKLLVKPGDRIHTGDALAISNMERTKALNSAMTTQTEKIIAERDGIVGRVDAQPNEMIAQNQMVLQYFEGCGYVAKIQINEDEISQVKVGQEVRLTCSALGNQVLSGVLSELGDAAYQITLSNTKLTVVDATVKLNEYDSRLKPGYSVVADIIVSKQPQATILPFEAVGQEDNGEYYIYTVCEDWAIRQYVKVAFENADGFVLQQPVRETLCINPESFSGEYERIKRHD